MRPVLALLTSLVLIQAAPVARADEDSLFDDSADYAGEFDAADTFAGTRFGTRWNRWTCTAHGSSLPFRFFRGQSYYFREGSGEGQEAKRVAEKIAVRNCDFAGVHGCTSELNKCTVESH